MSVPRIDPVALAGPSGVRAGTLLAFVWRHAPGICLALLLTAFLAGPRWWLLTTAPPEGARVQVSPWAASDMGYDLALFAPSIRDAYDGSVSINTLYDASRDDVPTPPGIPWLYAIGVIGRATGDPFSALALVTTLTALASLLFLYVLAYELTGNRWAAAAVLPVVVMAIGIFVQAGGLLPLRHWGVLRPAITVHSGREFHAWYRFVPPSIPLPVFFACVLAIPRAVESGRRLWMALAALALALLVYTYLFYWSAMAVALIAWCAWLAYRKDYVALRRLLAVGAVAAVLAVPELAARVHDALALPADARSRFGKESLGLDSGQFVNAAQRFAMGVPFMYMLLRGPERNRFYMALLVTPLVLDVTTGIVPQAEHYVTQVWHVFALPAFIAGGVALARELPRDRVRTAAIAFGALAVAGVAYLALFQMRATAHVEDQFAMDSGERAAFDWIDAHVTDNETVVSPSVNTNMLLPSLTPASRYISDGFFIRLKDDEIIDRFLRAQAAFGYKEDDVFSRLDPANAYPTSDRSVPGDGLQRHFEMSAAYFLFNWEITHPDKIASRLPEWRERYRKLLSEPHVLSAYPADYLYCGDRERYWAADRVAPGTFVQVAFQKGASTVYRIVSPDADGAQEFSGCQ